MGAKNTIVLITANSTGLNTSRTPHKAADSPSTPLVCTV